ncbi:MAG: hypothetical protein U0527_16635 [Candidatus Eisenbacteria bacterium]
MKPARDLVPKSVSVLACLLLALAWTISAGILLDHPEYALGDDSIEYIGLAKNIAQLHSFS